MLIDALLIGLACWRLSNMIVDEEGPWLIFERLREWIGVDEEYEGLYPEDEWYKKIFECVWCCSVWVALGITLVYAFYPGAALLLCLPFAISALAILAHQLVNRLQTEE